MPSTYKKRYFIRDLNEILNVRSVSVRGRPNITEFEFWVPWDPLASPCICFYFEKNFYLLTKSYRLSIYESCGYADPKHSLCSGFSHNDCMECKVRKCDLLQCVSWHDYIFPPCHTLCIFLLFLASYLWYFHLKLSWTSPSYPDPRDQTNHWGLGWSQLQLQGSCWFHFSIRDSMFFV